MRATRGAVQAVAAAALAAALVGVTAAPAAALGRGATAPAMAAALGRGTTAPAMAAAFVSARLFRSPALVAGPSVVFTRPFTDVDEGPVADAFALLAALEVFRGGTTGPEGPVNPDAAVTRADLVAVAVRLADLPEALLASDDAAGGGGGALPFADADEIPAWARAYARAAFREGLVRGVTEEGRLLFAAGRPVRRTDAARLLLRVLERRFGPRGGGTEEERGAVLASLLAASDGAAGPAGEAGRDGVSRAQMALMVERALLLPVAGEGGATTLLERGYDVRAGRLEGVDLERRRLRLVDEGGKPTLWEMEGRVFLRGAESLDALLGRQVRVIGRNRVALVEAAP